MGQGCPARDELCGAERRPTERAKFSNLGAVSRHDHRFAMLDSAEDIPTVVTQVSHAHRFHKWTVSPVIATCFRLACSCWVGAAVSAPSIGATTRLDAAPGASAIGGYGEVSD